MKVFFLAHIYSDSEMDRSYRAIVKLIQDMGHTVAYKHVFDTQKSLAKLSESDLQTRAKSLSARMLQSDCLVYEGTASSTGAGFLLSKALANSIPTLFLIQRKYSGLYLADPNRLLTIKQYNIKDLGKLEKTLESFLVFATKKRLSRRFNLMISDSLYEFLEKESKTSDVSMSDYVRNLLYEKMDGSKIK